MDGVLQSGVIMINSRSVPFKELNLFSGEDKSRLLGNRNEGPTILGPSVRTYHCVIGRRRSSFMTMGKFCVISHCGSRVIVIVIVTLMVTI